MTCSDARERLSALLERPPPADAEPLRAHVEGCGACRAELSALLGTDEAVRRAVFALGEAAPPAGYFDGLSDRVLARLDAPEVIPIAAARPRDRSIGRLGWVLGGGAALMGALGAFLFIQVHQGPAARQSTAMKDETPGTASGPPPHAATPAPAPPKPVVMAPPDKPADRPADKSVDEPAAKPMAKPTPMQPSEQPVGPEIQAGLDGIAAEARACWRAHGQDGTVVVQVTVGPDGRVTGVVPGGTLGATASGACVADAVRHAKFPAFAGAPRTFRYTFTLSPP